MKTILNNRVAIIAASFLMALSFFSCSENSDTNVKVPQFSGITFNKETLVAGEEVYATAVQYKKGKYLDRTTYVWTFDGAQQIGGGTTGVFYDSDKRDPSCSVILPETPGTYTITLTATYNTSGKSNNSSKEVEIKGGTVVYTTSPLTCTAKITQKVRVVAAN